ncbi:uncharacterized protein JCM10292_003944 [Rhodotorula paludigena]|uniref:uncharacterized protein n=1 Tax=Rhodotorula paludigena TaxID=86838 RepID=UPI0031820D58
MSPATPAEQGTLPAASHQTQGSCSDSREAPAATSASPPASPCKRVSFCPLALLIGVAGEGETDPALLLAAQQQRGRRRVAVRTFSFEAPQIGDVTAKAWHSVVNGFTASLDPFLNGAHGASGTACSSSAGRERDPSPDSIGSRRRSGSLSRSRSRSPSPGRAALKVPDPLDDPAFTPNPPIRVKLKLPALRRDSSHSCTRSQPGKPILRRNSDAPPSPARNPVPYDGSAGPPIFPTLSRSSSNPPPSACAHGQELGALVPLLACCRGCEPAARYGLLPDIEEARDESDEASCYQVKWSAAAWKQHEDEKRERAEREERIAQARALAASYAPHAPRKPGEQACGTEKTAEQEEEAARESKLGRVAAQGGVDALARARADGVGAAHHAYDDESVALVTRIASASSVGDGSGEPIGPSSPTSVVTTLLTDEPQELPTHAVNTTATLPTTHDKPAEPPVAAHMEPVSAASAMRPSPVSAPSAPAVLATTTDVAPAPSPSSRGDAPVVPPAQPKPERPPKRRFSSAAASVTRAAAAFGQGLVTGGGVAVGSSTKA